MNQAQERMVVVLWALVAVAAVVVILMLATS
jgi:hypothetical protein